MHIGAGTVAVSTLVDVHGETDMECEVVENSEIVELIFGCDPYVHVYLTPTAMTKLIDTLLTARGGSTECRQSGGS